MRGVWVVGGGGRLPGPSSADHPTHRTTTHACMHAGGPSGRPAEAGGKSQQVCSCWAGSQAGVKPAQGTAASTRAQHWARTSACWSGLTLDPATSSARNSTYLQESALTTYTPRSRPAWEGGRRGAGGWVDVVGGVNVEAGRQAGRHGACRPAGKGGGDANLWLAAAAGAAGWLALTHAQQHEQRNVQPQQGGEGGGGAVPGQPPVDQAAQQRDGERGAKHDCTRG